MNDKKEYNQLDDILTGCFYSCWYEDYPSGMPEVIHEIFESTIDRDGLLHVLEAIFDRLNNIPDLKSDVNLIFKRTDYNPPDEGLSAIEWLALLKAYMQGNTKVFDHLPLEGSLEYKLRKEESQDSFD